LTGSLQQLTEFGIIGLFSQQVGARPAWVSTGIGDDCAVLDLGGEKRLLVTCDMLVEGVHFLSDRISPRQLGQKSIAVNASDIAAMGGEPLAAFLGLGLTPQTSAEYVRAFRDGLLEGCRELGVELLGGDTVATRTDLAVSITLLGQVRAEEVVLRSGARPGDLLFLGGNVGDSAAGLRLLLHPDLILPPEHREALLRAHLEPRPQLRLGRFLASHRLAHSLIDVSDGLLQDLGHICASSGVGARVDCARLPISVSATEAASRSGLDPRDFALYGGEDYVLLFSAAPQDEDQIRDGGRALGLEVHPIGEITAEAGVSVLRDGRWVSPEREGYDHFR